MLPKLTENKQEITLKVLQEAGHALLLLPVSKSLPEVPGSVELKAAMKRRDLKLDALAKSPVAVQLPGGTLAVYAMLKADASTFEAHEQVRRALALLLAEHPKALTLAVFGEAEFATRAAEAAVYTALVNAVALPSRKSKREAVLKTVRLFGHQSGDGFARVQALAEGNVLTRSLTVQGPDELTPGVYRKRIKALAKQYGWTVEEYGFDKLKKMGAGAFCAVAQGSPAKDAAIVRISYKGPKGKGSGVRGQGAGKSVAFVGKGICFDTGGHNLKPAKYMQGMHEDMNGSAVVLGILAAASKMKLPVALEGWVALAENHISPEAYRQNEVITALNGTTIEVVHTDAEGRMVLADTLTLAANSKPDLIADFATLTGSMHYALGSRMSGVFATSSALAHQASRAAISSGERIVVFPYPEDYDSNLDSTVADVKQCSMEGEADHILATRFLSRFVGDTPWLHMDLSAHSCKGGLGAVMSDANGFGVAWGIALLDGLQAKA
ncbi:MAG TPA: leucyl aminopeptidase family protein [Thiobacillus sp.]|nr:MAG: peptidase M17 [Hydrogenophilales bacterium 16-64-40]OZA33788.1 MAG: peptidase M17 [Hydrogenophilales bacterium 17-64-65]HQS82273.1 leucyl aminopeptidase family protein [Thiobacillus sp.]HQT33549.1 leucyl aminopeptidase family protein [Thiobacillus sp.]